MESWSVINAIKENKVEVIKSFSRAQSTEVLSAMERHLCASEYDAVNVECLSNFERARLLLDIIMKHEDCFPDFKNALQKAKNHKALLLIWPDAVEDTTTEAIASTDSTNFCNRTTDSPTRPFGVREPHYVELVASLSRDFKEDDLRQLRQWLSENHDVPVRDVYGCKLVEIMDIMLQREIITTYRMGKFLSFFNSSNSLSASAKNTISEYVTKYPSSPQTANLQ